MVNSFIDHGETDSTVTVSVWVMLMWNNTFLVRIFYWKICEAKLKKKILRERFGLFLANEHVLHVAWGGDYWIFVLSLIFPSPHLCRFNLLASAVCVCVCRTRVRILTFSESIPFISWKSFPYLSASDQWVGRGRQRCEGDLGRGVSSD